MDRRHRSRLSRRHLLKTSFAAGAAVASDPLLGRPARPALAAPATPVGGGDPAARFRELGDLVVARMAELKIPGVALGVIADGEEYVAGFGVTNVDHPLPVDADTLFQVGSITKTFTGTGMARLIEQGTLDLEAPVRTHLTEFRVADAGVSARVTLRHLVTHSAGFGELFTDTGDGDDALARYVAAMADLPQIAPLGKHFSYNNAAVLVAGRLIEVATGQPYEAAIRELVLAPLGLRRSFFFPEEIMTEAFAVGHGASADEPGAEPEVLTPWAIPRGAHPAGGLAASVADQLRFARFHLGEGGADGERVLSAAGLRGMRASLGPGGAFGANLVDGVGMGWFLTTVGGAQVLFHEGGTNGQQAVLVLVPERGFALSLLTNSDSSDALLDDATTRALERFLGLTRPLAATTPLPPAQGAPYVGHYQRPDGSTARVDAAAGALLLTPRIEEAAAAGALALTPIGPDLFRMRNGDRTSFVDFGRDGTGAVGWLRLGGRLAPRLR